MGRYGNASTAGGSRDQGGPVVDVVLVVLVVVVQLACTVTVRLVGTPLHRLEVDSSVNVPPVSGLKSLDM
jgi:hypothetical protein